MFDQYWRIKDSVPQALLFYRMGDFYELFGEDALTAAPLLEVQLTARDKDAEIPIPMCGIPFHAWDSYADRILSRGLKIALCEQLSEPGKSKLVERGVVRILTPGLPVDFKKLDARAPHYFASVSLHKKDMEICLLDFLGGHFFKGRIESPEALKDLFLKSDPKEILIPAALLKDDSARAALFFLDPHSDFYRRLTPWSGTSAASNLEEYLVYTQRGPHADLKKLLPEARPLRDILGRSTSDYAVLPANVLEQWDVFPALFDGLDGSGSALGSRKARSLLASPLRNVERLKVRQKLFAEWSKLAAEILTQTREVYDIERILGRFRIGAADPKELLRFVRSLEKIFLTLSVIEAPLHGEGAKAFAQHLQFEGIELGLEKRRRLEALFASLKQKLNLEVDVARSQGLAELLNAGFDAELDQLKSLASNSQKWLEDFEEQLKKSTDIGSLKLRFNKVFGYYIEVTKTHLAKVPAFFERKQTTVNGERFTCLELRTKEAEILGSQSKSEAKAREVLQQMERDVLAHTEDLSALLEAFAWVDALAGLAQKIEKARRWGPWNFPRFLDQNFFSFRAEEVRHPLLENLMWGSFVPASLDMREKRILLLTGPNMAGKSTLMREMGLALLLAQCGLPVPATDLEMTCASGFYSRMGATDKILEGDSTFMVEMKETARILSEADAQSFVLIDEIGRGTSTQDGLAIAQAVLEHLAEKTGALCLFATHYHELSEWGTQFRSVQNASMAIVAEKGDLHFLRTLEMKAAESSYGIFVARLAGLPRSLLQRAEKYFAGHERSEKTLRSQLDIFSQTEEPSSSEGVEPSATEIFAEKVIARLRDLDLEALSPKEAWTTLESLQKDARPD